MADAGRAGQEAGIYLVSAAEEVVRRWLPNALYLRQQGIVRGDWKNSTQACGGLVLGKTCFPVSI